MWFQLCSNRSTSSLTSEKETEWKGDKNIKTFKKVLFNVLFSVCQCMCEFLYYNEVKTINNVLVFKTRKSHLLDWYIIFDFTCSISASSTYFCICNLLITDYNHPSSFQLTFPSITMLHYFLLFLPIQVVSLLSFFCLSNSVPF